MKVAILGYGKMGKTIEQLIDGSEHSDDDVVLKINSRNPEELTVERLSAADVAIDFSKPSLAYAHIQKCFEANIPVVSGTTGWLEHLDEVKQQCNRDRKTLFYAPNFSIGVNIFFELSNQLAAMMNAQSQYEVSLEEVHHTEKLDAPSGTAIRLAEMILQRLDRKKRWTVTDEVSSDEIAISSKRVPQVPGTHNIQYLSDVDSIEIKHTAKSRLGFAAGAVEAARWVIGKTGYYEMKDMLNI